MLVVVVVIVVVVAVVLVVVVAAVSPVASSVPPSSYVAAHLDELQQYTAQCSPGYNHSLHKHYITHYCTSSQNAFKHKLMFFIKSMKANPSLNHYLLTVHNYLVLFIIFPGDKTSHQ